MSQQLIDSIDALLPQTQCGKCNYPACRPYAEAIAQGQAINQCPPGGENTIKALAALLQLPAIQLNPDNGIESPLVIAQIRESQCIGCTKCIQVCPTDAIMGAAKLMHTVIVSQCTGCELCLDPCPVDCIDMLAATSLSPSPVRAEKAGHWRNRFENRERRETKEKLGLHVKANQKNQPKGVTRLKSAELDPLQAKQDIFDAVARIKSKRKKQLDIK